MKKYSNNDYGDRGQYIWVFYIGLSLILLLSIFCTFMADKLDSSFIAPMFLCIVVFLLIFLWGLYYLSNLKTVIQSVWIDDSKITVKKFRSNIELSDESFLSIGFYPITSKVKALNFLDPKIQGIVIKMKSGESLLISPKTVDFDGLVSELREFGKSRPDIECNL